MQSLEAQGRCAIWKRTSSPTTLQTLRKDISSYLSEVTKKGLDAMATEAKNQPNWLKEGVDYLTKEDRGRLKAFGFLRDDVTKLRGLYPHQMENNDLIDASLDAWQARLKTKKIKRVAHKYVLSLNPKLCEILMQTKHSADELLTNAARQVMRRYQEKYYPNERIGYLMGIHHDKAHLHAHIMLFPTTESGKLLRITDESPKQGGRKPFLFMRETAEKEVERFYKKEIQHPFRATHRNNQKYTQPRMLAFVAMHRAGAAAQEKSFGGSAQVAGMHQERERLLNGSKVSLRDAMKEGYEKAEGTYTRLMDYSKLVPSGFVGYEDNLNSKVASFKEQLDSCYKELKELKVTSQETAQTRRSLYSDVSNWTHFRFNHAHITQGGYNMRDHEVADWAAKKLGKSDALGRLIHEWIEEKRSSKEAIDLPKQMLQLMASAENPVAAQKFTEKDPFTRKCISFGNPKLRDKTCNMLNHFYSQQAVHSLQSQKDFVREFLKAEIKRRSAEIDQIKHQRERISKRVWELRGQLQAFQIERDLVKGVKLGRRPGFLEEFKHWEVFNLPIPIDALDVMRNSSAKKEGTDKLSQATSFNTRVHQILRGLRNKSMEEGFPSISEQFRVSEEASSSVPRLKEERHRISDNEVATANAAKFLGPRKDGLPRVESAHAISTEERRLNVRDRYMNQDDDGELGR